MYVKKFTSFCQVLKKCAQTKCGSYFLRQGIYSTEMKNGIKGALRPGAGKGPGAQQQTHMGHFEQDLR